jgi:hypothetical protein
MDFTKFRIYHFGSLPLQEETFHQVSFLMILDLDPLQEGRSEIGSSQSSREWKFKSDNAALISRVLSIQDMIKESGIPSGVEIGGGPLLFAPPLTRTSSLIL